MNENIKNIAKIINSKCRFQNCNDCIKSEDTCWKFETAIALDKAGYRKQSETVKEIIKKILAFSYYIKFEDTNGKDREELVVYESKIKQIAEYYGKEDK
jgi:hypothetical protein